MKIVGFAAAIGLAALSVAPVAMAADNFTVTVTSNGSSATLGFASAEPTLNQLKNSALSTTLPAYTTTSIANAVINYRGVTATASYGSAGTALNFTIPAVGLNQTFTGATRNDSQQGCEPKLCAQAATSSDISGRLKLAFAGGLAASLAQ
ncbi:MAG: hypothetical protein EXR07_15085 [Acetobacteraceae bacterium]|nr:hypothetical protein [Acetobacteraceae bacterium]